MQEVLLIALVVLLFFGGRKIPELRKASAKVSVIQGRYERHGERNQSRKYRQERGVTWQRKTKRTA